MPVSADTVRLALVRMTGSPPAPPAPPAFTLARITGETIAFAATTTLSNELDPSGQVRDSILTGGAATGAISFELSDHDAFEEYLAAIFGDDWAGDELIPGVDLFYYLIEKTFPGVPVSGESSFHRFAPSAFIGGSVVIAPNTPITGTAEVNGGVPTLDTEPLAGATYPDPGTEPVLQPQDVVMSIGGWAAAACFGQFTMTFANGTRGVPCIGTLGDREKVRGRFTVQIAAQVYYATDEPLHAFVDRTEFPVLVEVRAPDATVEYAFEFPRCKIDAAPVNAGGTGQDVIIQMTISALYDATAGYTCKVTRGA
jgi:hypothetical protein